MTPQRLSWHVISLFLVLYLSQLQPIDSFRGFKIKTSSRNRRFGSKIFDVNVIADGTDCLESHTYPYICSYCMYHSITGTEQIVSIPADATILSALISEGVNVSYSCQTGLCTECASYVHDGLEHIELEAAILDEEISAQGYVLTCCARISGPGVKLELGMGEILYEAQFGELVDNHRRRNPKS